MKRPKVRRSQLVSTFGVGGLLPAENESFMVRGLQDWGGGDVVSEPRLARSLQVPGLRLPPAGGRRDVPVIRFPRLCSCSHCGRLGQLSDFNSPFNEPVCRLHNPHAPLTPSRLIVACANGHVGDFPYFGWLHSGTSDEQSGGHDMSLHSAGRTSSLADLVLRCTCGVSAVSLDGSFDGDALRGVSRCRGERPWLHENRDDCDQTPRTLQRGASNVWFPAVRSAISIPPFSEAVSKFVQREWAMLSDPEALTSKIVIDGLVRKSGGRYTSTEILAEAHRRHDLHAAETPTDVDLRKDEYRALKLNHEELGARSDFVCLERDIPDELADQLSAVRKVTRLREVRALYGFSRLAAEDDVTAPGFCRLTTDESPAWLPAIEVLGEGLFLELPHERLQAWSQTAFADGRRLRLQNNADHAAEAADTEPRRIDIRLVAMHTLAHALIDQLALDAGYPAASIRERLFVDDDMSGVLLYTATSDAAGSLGGLAAQAEPDKLAVVVTDALRRLSWCSSDPVCIESAGSGTDGLNLAACHACVLAPETSCELQNVLLDRGTLFGTPTEPDVGLFSPEP